MKIAFMVMVHADAPQLCHLVNRLAPNEYFDSEVFIHVDAKSNLSDFAGVLVKDYVYFTPNRINVTRCGISQVDAVMELMKAVTARNIIFDRYILITGQDYPVVSNEELAERLSRNTEYMRCYRVTGSSMTNKISRYYFYNQWTTGTKGKDLLRRTIQLIHRPFRKRNQVIIEGRLRNVYYSSAYFAVTHGLFLELYRLGSSAKYHKYFKTAITSDEMYFATIAANGRYRDKLEIVENSSHTLLDNSAITYFDYKDRPIVLTDVNYDEILDADRMFARKFSSSDSIELMNKLNFKVE